MNGIEWWDWTLEQNRTNSSKLFLDLCDEVERIIRGDAAQLINGNAGNTARLIVAQLAHKHKLIPST